MKSTKVFSVFFSLLLIIIISAACNSGVVGQQSTKQYPVKSRDTIYRYAQSNAFNIGESKLGSKILMKGKTKEIPTLEAMADLYSPFDIVGIEEVSTGLFGARAVGELINILSRKGHDWGMLYSDPTVGPGKERYSVIFNKSKFEDIHAPKTGLVKSLENEIDREPFHAVLKEKSSGKYLHIYLFHLRPKNKKPILEVEAVGRNADSFEKQNVIISGDFNLPAKKLTGVFEGILGFKHHINSKTSLKEQIVNGNYLGFEYDNIFTSSGITVINSGVLDFVPLVGDLAEARKISDHLIPYIEFKIEGKGEKYKAPASLAGALKFNDKLYKKNISDFGQV